MERVREIAALPTSIKTVHKTKEVTNLVFFMPSQPVRLYQGKKTKGKKERKKKGLQAAKYEAFEQGKGGINAIQGPAPQPD